MIWVLQDLPRLSHCVGFCWQPLIVPHVSLILGNFAFLPIIKILLHQEWYGCVIVVALLLLLRLFAFLGRIFIIGE